MQLDHQTKRDTLERVWSQLTQEQVVDEELTTTALGSTIIKLHPDGVGVPKKVPTDRGLAREMATKLHLLARDCRRAMALALTRDETVALGWRPAT